MDRTNSVIYKWVSIFIILVFGLYFASIVAKDVKHDSTHTTSNSGESIFVVGEDWDGNLPISGKQFDPTEQVQVLVMPEQTVDAAHPNLELVNLPSNTVYMKYLLKFADTGEVLYGNDEYVKPNGVLKVPVLDKIAKAGTYIISCEIRTYDIDTKVECVSANQNIKLHVNK